MMENTTDAATDTAFIEKNAAQLFRRFSISFRFEYSCADYYIESLRTGRCISKDILFTMDYLENRMVRVPFLSGAFHPVRFKIPVSDLFLSDDPSFSAPQPDCLRHGYLSDRKTGSIQTFL